MTGVRSSLRHALLAIGAFCIPGLGHATLGRWRTALLLAAAGLLAIPLSRALVLFALHPALLALVVIIAYVPCALSLALHLRARAADPTAATAPWTHALGFMVATLLIASQVNVFSRDHVARAFQVPSVSMEPTLLNGDYLYVDRRLSSQDYRHGDLIAFRFPQDRKIDYLKRVIAMGGDQIEIRDQVVLLNGAPLDEPYALHTILSVLPGSLSPRDNLPPLRVPTGDLFVMGDQRENSFDSRFWGFVPESDVLGRATATYFSRDPATGRIRWERIGRSMAALEALARNR